MGGKLLCYNDEKVKKKNTKINQEEAEYIRKKVHVHGIPEYVWKKVQVDGIPECVLKKVQVTQVVALPKWVDVMSMMDLVEKIVIARVEPVA